MNKLEVQQRVLHNGKPIELDDFNWDEETKTFSSSLAYLVLDFSDIDSCTFNTYSNCTFYTRDYCTFNTYWNCNFKTGSDCTFKTSSDCTFDTDSACTFDTGDDCTFDTDSACTFDTGDDCTFDTDSDCTFNTGYESVIVRRDQFQVIQPEPYQTIITCPYVTPGYLTEIDGKFYLNGDQSLGEHVLADGILSRVVNQKGNVYKVINHDSEDVTYLVRQGKLWSHGDTLREARDSLMYKISDRDTSEYKGLTLDSVLTKEEAIKMYRVVTGACEAGTKSFVKSLEEVKDSYTVREIVDLTKGQYGNNELFKFFQVSMTVLVED